MLYHKDVYLPRGVRRLIPNVPIRLVWSKHAIDQLWYKYGLDYRIMPTTLILRNNPIEVEVENDRAIKVVVRIPSPKVGYDACLAIMVNGTVKTVWLNHNSDYHTTLDKSKYQKKVNCPLDFCR